MVEVSYVMRTPLNAEQEGSVVISIAKPRRIVPRRHEISWPLVIGPHRTVIGVDILIDVPRVMRRLAKVFPFLRSDIYCHVDEQGVHHMVISRAPPWTRSAIMTVRYREEM